MYNNLGIHWASSIPAFLALMCVPFPFLFYKYGRSIRIRCKFAAEAAKELEEMQDHERESEAIQVKWLMKIKMRKKRRGIMHRRSELVE